MGDVEVIVAPGSTDQTQITRRQVTISDRGQDAIGVDGLSSPNATRHYQIVHRPRPRTSSIIGRSLSMSASNLSTLGPLIRASESRSRVARSCQLTMLCI